MIILTFIIIIQIITVSFQVSELVRMLKGSFYEGKLHIYTGIGTAFFSFVVLFLILTNI